MVDIIIIIIVIVLLAIALKASLKHFKGEGACCGGSSIDHKHKTLDRPIIGKKKVKIEGMHCENCAQHITHALEKIDGVIAKTDYKKGISIISFDRNINNQTIESVIQRAGYKVKEITE